ASADRFEESSNGQPLVTGKIAVRRNKIGELGISYMGGVYNKFEDDGIVLDEKRRLNVFALDFNTTIPGSKTYVVAEWAWVNINISETYSQQYGDKQQGGFIDIVQPLLKRDLLGFKNTVLSAACRLEYVDWNVGSFTETGTNIGDNLWAIVPGVSYRPTAQTVIRINYRRQWQKDLLDNPPSRTAGIQFGISSYF
ncbi:MAG: hypothetical protein C0490_06965, partial [Marivirga sp.]|nr:hypothetical protein [Marivirga sp.]